MPRIPTEHARPPVFPPPLVAPGVNPLQIINLTNTMCTALGVCRYEQRRGMDVQVVALNKKLKFRDSTPASTLLIPGANETIARCLTTHPALARWDHRLWGRVRAGVACARAWARACAWQ